MAVQDLALMTDGAPQVMGLPVDLHEDLVQVPLPSRELSPVARSADPNLTGKHRPETVAPRPHAFVTAVYPTLTKEVFDIPQRERTPNVHHDRKLIDLERRFEIAQWISRHAGMLRDLSYPLNCPVPLTMPDRL